MTLPRAALDPSESAIDEFAIVRLLGEGTSARIYEVEREGVRYAMKLAKSEDEDGSVLRRFRTEAAILRQVDHSSVVSALAVGTWKGFPYTVMELVTDELLSVRLQRRSMPETEALALAIELAGALAAVHRLGLVHRDIHPDNVFWLASSNRLKLIDFGLSTTEANKTDSTTVGTVLYLSPEQSGSVNRVVDRRSDLYSVGALLFHAVTGAPPFVGADVAQVVSQHINKIPPLVSTQRPDISPEFSTLIGKLLQKDPDDRFQDAISLIESVRHLFLKCTGRPYQEIALHLDKLVGRELESEELAAIKEAALREKAAFVLIEGAPGAGKSRLAREAIAIDKTQNVLLSGKCVLGSLFALIRQLLDALTENARTNDSIKVAIKPFLSKNLGACSVLSPELLRVCEVPVSSNTVDQEVSFENISELFRAISSVRPLTLFIDDVQWIDEASRELLLKITAGSRASRVFIVATARSDENSQAKLSLFRELFADYLTKRVELGPLSEENTAKLATNLLGSLPLPVSLGGLVYKISSGNPFAVGECVRSLVMGGVIAPAWNEWDVAEEALTALKLPDNVVDLVRQRMHSLSPFTKNALAAASCVGHRFSPELLAAMLNTKLLTVGEALAEAEQSYFISRLGKTEWTFVHDRVAEAASTILPENEMALFHRTLRDLLIPRAETGQATWSNVAKHQLGSNDLSEPKHVAQLFLNAANEAFSGLAFDEAYRHFHNWEDVHKKFDLKASSQPLTFAVVCDRIGKKHEATERYKKTLGETSDPTMRAKIFGMMSRNHVENLETTDGLAAIVDGFKTIRMRVPTFAKDLLLCFFNAFVSEIMYQTKLGYAKCPPSKRNRYEAIVSLHEQLAFLKFFEIDPVTGMVGLLKALPYGIRLGPSRPLVALYSTVAIFLGIFKCRKAMEACTKRALRFARPFNDAQLVSGIKAYHAFGINYTGKDLEAQEIYYRLLVDYKETLSAENYSYVSAALMALTLDRGQVKETLRIALAGIDHLSLKSTGERQRDHYLTWCNSLAMVSLASLGRMTEAQPYKDKLDRYFDAHPNDPFHWGVHLMNLMHLYAEQREEGAVVESLVEKHKKLKIFIPTAIMQLRHFYIAQANLRFDQWRSCRVQNEKHARWIALRRAMWQLWQSCHTDLFRSYYVNLKAAIAVEKKKYSKAEELLKRAELLSNRASNLNGLFRVALTRARALAQQGNATMAKEHARMIIDMCIRHGWTYRVEQVSQEFALHHASENRRTDTSIHQSPGHSGGKTVSQALAEKGREALIRVSLAASESMNTEMQVSSALAEILKILGGDRAALLLYSPQKNRLDFFAGRNSQGSPFEVLEKYSTTAVDRVWREQKAVIFSGSKDREIVQAQSIVVHDLRSIIAAPVTVKGKKLGVVYVDSSVLKGMFNESDVDILASIATQIGIALESSRAAALEVDKVTMEKDLELSGIVQKMLIPEVFSVSSKNFGLEVSYTPANKAGGDWVWYEPRGENSLRIFLGDVTGHGPGPAIMTGVVAGANQILRDSSLSLVEQVEKIGAVVHAIGRDSLWLSYLALELDAEREILTVVNAACPSVSIYEPGNDRIARLTVAGNPLGMLPIKLGFQEIPFRKGFRAMICTDGAYEFNTKGGKEFGLRKLIAAFKDTCDMPLNDAISKLEATIQEKVEGAFADDRAIILLTKK